MRKLILSMFMMSLLGVYAQDTIPAKPKADPKSETVLKGDSVIFDGGYSIPGAYYERYYVFTDSIVHEVFLKFRSSDNTFMKKIIERTMSRERYYKMEEEYAKQEGVRKETVEFINRRRVSPDVWLRFKLYELLK